MNDKVTVSTFQLFQMFPTPESARTYLESHIWPQGPVCPFCEEKERITPRKAGFYRCNACSKDFTVRTKTIFERSHVPLNKWLYAMYLLLTARKGISSIQLSKEIGITQKSAWFLLQRIREACSHDGGILQGIVEVDETFIGGRETNKHFNKKTLKGARGTVGKTPVLGIRERGGRTFAKPVPNIKAVTLMGEIQNHIEAGATVHTDEHGGYIGLQGYKHESVNHIQKEYVRGNVTTNGIESVWAVMKRGLHGVYHHASKKHLARYVDEFTFRLNDGNVERHTLDRMQSLVKASTGKRLTYEALTA